MTKNPGTLILDLGPQEGLAEFSGFLFGGDPKVTSVKGYGEVVFNTSMSGYQEVLTDPSYFGQIVCMTYPHIGNTGVNATDEESISPWLAGFLIYDLNDLPSSWRSEGSLDSYLKKHQIPGLYGIDTRALTLTLRSRGVLRGIILPESEKKNADKLFKDLPRFEGRDLISEVTTQKPYLYKGAQSTAPNAKRIVVMDFGVKQNILRSLSSLGCSITVVPASTSAKEIMDLKPDGVFLSNGPGDPEAAHYASETIGAILGKVPIFGVCMGHQLLSLALGAKTYKLKFGHRGSNHPVKELSTGRVSITAQNHGYAVQTESLCSGIEITHLHLNDKTVAGIEIKSKKAFSVQYHPEACPGPHDSADLFQKFVTLIKES
jgi:carbamoyl-phosphate synthase small subunit